MEGVTGMMFEIEQMSEFFFGKGGRNEIAILKGERN